MFYCVLGGDELEQLQPGRCLPVGPWKDHRAVEWATEQQTGAAQSKETTGVCYFWFSLNKTLNDFHRLLL